MFYFFFTQQWWCPWHKHTHVPRHGRGLERRARARRAAAVDDWNAGRHAEVTAYCEHDAKLTLQLYTYAAPREAYQSRQKVGLGHVPLHPTTGRAAGVRGVPAGHSVDAGGWAGLGCRHPCCVTASRRDGKHISRSGPAGYEHLPGCRMTGFGRWNTMLAISLLKLENSGERVH
jgi:hypothetical protein